MTGTGTPWATGRLRGAGGERLLFGTMYEDAAIEEEAFEGRSALFAVAASGDTALTLAGADRHVVAVDLNRAQVDYLRGRLRGEPRRAGTVDRLMAAARRRAPAVGWTSSRVQRFLELADVSTQRRVFDRFLDTARFRVLMDMALSPTALVRAYRPEFVGFLPAPFGPAVRGRLRRGVSTHANRGNPYARLLFAGDPPEVRTPPGGALDVHHGDAVTYLASQPSARFDGFTLSNILDGPDPAFRARLAEAIRHAATSDAVVVLRSLREPIDHASACWAASDRSMIWGTVTVIEAARFPEYVRKLT